MGVMACHRQGCNNIMCDRYNSDHGYICNECFNELVESGKTNIQKFMDSDKRKKVDKEARGYDYYNEIFPGRY